MIALDFSIVPLLLLGFMNSCPSFFLRMSATLFMTHCVVYGFHYKFFLIYSNLAIECPGRQTWGPPIFYSSTSSQFN